ncbi:carboxynorspermidine decarboxylase [Moraxella catarrhalis]|uniref:carboxynorspermidine decarboxylase n=1 Tax=Moraxella catarrhalis TaxID=480 RepID=UPI000EA89844|nr:carboxynorspermidine decarboxylase [Moraxella catarrhalis]MPX48606.1 carboxynorspermidine decarboxylase [Moraxella catarrhalis]MPX63991.1 carboxynorspermidine decarboxylase [Moraxella catarrhalis]RKL77255.1 carboxynorspermidine decarboxylase [Moraxella catarrhalis]
MSQFFARLTPKQKQCLATIQTPYYLLDERAIIDNLSITQKVCHKSGAKALLALKCFATWGVFESMQPYLHGTTSSSLKEVRLGKECFGGETHAYSVAYADHEINEVLGYCDKIIFNSINQLKRFGQLAHDKNIPVGLRLNPQTSNSSFIIADPARPFSRLGEHDVESIMAIADQITGVMIHNNCENTDFEAFSQSLTDIENRFGELFHRLEWISFGGGIHYIDQNYPLDKFINRLKNFSETYGVQIYLEPGEASVHQGAVLVTSVLDVMYNNKPLAVVDASIEAHMLDLLIYRQSSPLAYVNETTYDITGADFDGTSTDETSVRIYGKSCLAGDIFGDYTLNEPLKIGDKVAFGNAAAYTMVKKNWFNGVDMPSIVIIRQDGEIMIQRQFDYEDYKASLS